MLFAIGLSGKPAGLPHDLSLASLGLGHRAASPRWFLQSTSSRAAIRSAFSRPSCHRCTSRMARILRCGPPRTLGQPGASNRSVVQQLRVAAPAPGIGHGEFRREGAVAGVGGAQVGAGNYRGRRGSRQGWVMGRLSSGRARRKQADDACQHQCAHDYGARRGHGMNLPGRHSPGHATRGRPSTWSAGCARPATVSGWSPVASVTGERGSSRNRFPGWDAVHIRQRASTRNFPRWSLGFGIASGYTRRVDIDAWRVLATLCPQHADAVADQRRRLDVPLLEHRAVVRDGWPALLAPITWTR